MKTMKKVSAFLLMVVLCMSIMVMPAFATTTSQDGLEVTLTTDKETYDKGEQIEATLVVTNTNDFAVSNVSLENTIPEGYKLSEGSTATKHVESLAPGEMVSLAVTYVAVDSDNNEDKPDSGDNTGDTDNPGSENDADNGNNSGNNESSGNDADIPQTGDDSNIALWFALMVVASIGIGTIISTKKKKGKRFLSLFLCFAMVGTIFSSSVLPVKPVKAAELQSQSVSISETVIVDDTHLTLSAVVKYEVEEDIPADAGEISFREPSDEHIVLDEATGIYYVDNEILITGKENVTQEEIKQIVNGIGGTIVGCVEITNDYQVELQISMTVSELNELLDQLNNNNAIEEASVHYLYKMEIQATPNDSKWKSEEWSSDYPEGINWGVEAINAMGAWEHYDQMSYVNVGIIDSMFDTNHDDLVYTKVWNNPDNITVGSPNSYSTPEEYADAYSTASHGTHVSGTFAACYNNNKGIAGVAPKVNLYGYSIMGSDTDSIATTKGFAGMMEWKYALANLITSNCKVINVSMAGVTEPDFEVSAYQGNIIGAFLEKLLNKGYDFVIVQSAGNRVDGKNSDDAIKNGLFVAITQENVKDRIIVVGAIGNNGSHKNGLFGWFGDRVFDGYYYADISNFGDRVDVVAPGVNIYSTVPGDKYENNFTFSMNWNIYQKSWDGTSMAAPHVAGIAAMCFSVNPSLTGKQVKTIIKNTATTTVTDTNEGHPRQDYRVVNASAAVELALNTHGEAISPVNPATGIVMGNVRGYDENHQADLLSDVNISAYRISEYDGNLSEYASATQSDSHGNYELILEAGKYYINIYKDGYLPFAICDVTVTNDQITYLDNVILIADSGAEVSNYIHGTVRNALTGSSIEGVTVRLRPGWDNKNGTLATVIETGTNAVTVTDSNGQYSFEVLEGCYTAEFIKEGYITGYANVICTNMNDADQDAVLTPVLSDDEYRVVLTWSSTPRDLDSHISGPLSTGDRFHVYYRNMSASDNGEIVAKLDLDDRSSYGPETITLKKTQAGVYKYAVHDYTNSSSTSSTALSMSGAKVELYRGNTLIATYNVPINTTGTVWNVFEIEGDTIRTINTMENNSNSSTVCSITDQNTESVSNVTAISPNNPDKNVVENNCSSYITASGKNEEESTLSDNVPTDKLKEDAAESDISDEAQLNLS